MKHRLQLALILAGIGAVGLIGCKSSGGRGGADASAPKGVDRYVQAMQQYQAGDKERAMAQLIEATRVNPNLIMPRVMLGDMYRSEGNMNDAVTQYEQVTKLDPYYASNWYKLGVGYQFAERLKDAAGSYQKALKLKPADAKSNMNLGLVQLYLGNTDQALEYARKATQLEPRNAAAWSNLGVTLDAMGDYPRAEEAYRKGIDLDPDNPATLVNLATNLMAQNKAPEASELMKRAVSISNTAALRKRYGDALAKSGRYDEAVAQYQQALKLDGRYYPALTELGFTRLAEYRKGLELDDSKRADAVTFWKRSMEINSNQPKVEAALKEYGHSAQSLLEK
ncbi:MAG TPA: tetratricopeptide repeat protein [Tepidisphaeraceae bacterium]